jgi:hypothetical protein
MFVQILDQVTEQTNLQCQSSNNVDDYLLCAINIWCSKLEIYQDETNYILRGYNQQAIRKFLYYLYQEGTTEKKILKIPTPLGEHSTGFTIENPFYKHINALFYRMNITLGNVKFIVLIAFGVTAVGYCLYRLNQVRQRQASRREELRQYNSNPPSFTVQTSTDQVSPVQRITKQFLVLVVSASQADFLELLKAKGCISINDGEELYEMTKYLWLGSETDFNQKRTNINQYEIFKEEESEYDIRLVYIELKQADKGFEPNVNQLDRYDAFRNLADLAVNFEVSPRFRMEAYENIDVYNR